MAVVTGAPHESGSCGHVESPGEARGRWGEAGNGADDETRTRDIDLGKVALYQLSYIRSAARTGAAEAMLPQRVAG